ncbi:hypothetical protein N656DRAFT_805141 [Canariomyces notabilis]|uniref:Uncharacterized protein n=1 Tax=Canariomyces notabilis TaxID=2074819 RepID=A0AAN6TE31_9PEZI|nr:hypothetical protein N656DRAFT_805141 [Canariomyces arenarius]
MAKRTPRTARQGRRAVPNKSSQPRRNRTGPATASTADDEARRQELEAKIAEFRPYVPGSGPPPPKISLLPPVNGTTGYIIDQMPLPRRVPGGETQDIAVYYIGYADRPGERALVPYFQILEHVSPRELEWWNDKLEERRSVVRREEEEERRMVKERERERRRELRRRVSMVEKRITRSATKRLGREIMAAS